MAGMAQTEAEGQAAGGGLRAGGRLLLVPALLAWPVFLLGFGSGEGQMLCLVLAVGPLAIGLLLGALGVAIGSVRARSRTLPWRGRGRWWAVLAVAIWVAMLALRPDARLWLWRNEEDLVRVVAAAHARGPSLHREVVEGHVVSAVGTVVLVHCGAGLVDQGVAYDPDRELRAGGDGAVRLDSVAPLWGPGRGWTRQD